MESLRKLFKIGNGPSSSHTMGPRAAAKRVAAEALTAARCEVTLYGALAATGRGHLTDVAILEVLQPMFPTTIIWEPDTVLPRHTNGMKFTAYAADGSVKAEQTWYSIGGGDIVREGEEAEPRKLIYEMTHIKDILKWCNDTGRSYWEYVDQVEGPEIWEYLRQVWEVMKAAVLPWKHGLQRIL